MANASERWQELKGQAMAWLAEGAKDLHNQIVPAFPAHSQGVDQPGTPLNMTPQPAAKSGPEAKPSFESVMAKQASMQPAQVKDADKGLEL